MLYLTLLPDAVLVLTGSADAAGCTDAFATVVAGETYAGLDYAALRQLGDGEHEEPGPAVKAAKSAESDDFDARVDAIADILGGLLGDDALAALEYADLDAKGYGRAWVKEVCRDSIGRFAVCGGGEERLAAAEDKVAALRRADDKTRHGLARELADHLNTLTVAQLHGLKASAGTKAALVAKLTERFRGLTPQEEQPGAHATLEAAVKWGEARGVRVVAGTSGFPVGREELNTVNREVAKLPQSVLDKIAAAGSKLDVVGGAGITDHPEYAHLKGVTPRGWEGSGRTWDTVPGAGAGGPGGNTIVATGAFFSRHGSANLVLHEHGHTLDAADRGAVGGASDQADWKTIHASTTWPSTYESRYPEEGWAESFAKFYHGPDTRGKLPQPVQDYFQGRYGT